MQTECLIIFQEIFPCVIIIVDILYRSGTIHLFTRKSISSVIRSYKIIAVVVTEVCTE